MSDLVYTAEIKQPEEQVHVSLCPGQPDMEAYYDTWLESLKQVVRDLASGNQDKKNAAEHWLYAEHNTHEGSFRFICEAHNSDYEHIRNGIYFRAENPDKFKSLIRTKSEYKTGREKLKTIEKPKTATILVAEYSINNPKTPYKEVMRMFGCGYDVVKDGKKMARTQTREI